MSQEEQCNHNCESCGADCPSRSQAPEKETLNEMSSVKKVIGVVSGKGGVGKSLVTSMLAVLMQRRGFHSAVLDADITVNRLSPKCSGYTSAPRAMNWGCSRCGQNPA